MDYNGDGRGIGYNVPSLLGIDASPPYYHNGACESLACVVGNVKHRTANGKQPDKLAERERPRAGRRSSCSRSTRARSRRAQSG